MWKRFVRMAIPFIRIAGEEYRDQDADNVGRDDLIGSSLIYVAALLEAILVGGQLPKAPAGLK